MEGSDASYSMSAGSLLANAQCSPTGGQPIGQVTGSGEVTLCCQ
jgi:hypothetical protein